MRVEGNLADQKGRELVELPTTEKANKSSSKKNKRRQRKSSSSSSSSSSLPPMPTVVQKLFDTCRGIFSNGGAGVVPSPADVERLRSVLDHMSPADVGLTQDMPYFENLRNGGTPPVTYLHLYECDKFSIGIFCLPPSAVIPLHNHPCMTVFSKLLFGSMHIKSYDWTDRPQPSNESIEPSHHKFSNASALRLAKVQTDAVFTAPCNTSILYPAAGGNMHRFTALTSCAVLDVLGPPYSDAEGRHCTYYSEHPYASFSGNSGLVPGEGEGYAWLEEEEKPEDFFVVGAEYTGPKILEN